MSMKVDLTTSEDLVFHRKRKLTGKVSQEDSYLGQWQSQLNWMTLT